jgi:hypothetical protein
VTKLQVTDNADVVGIISCMKVILDSVRPVVEGAKSVRVNEDAIKRFCATVEAADLDESEYREETILRNISEEERIAFTFVYDTVNFSYWGDPKWTIQVGGKLYDGGAAMMMALKMAAQNDKSILSAEHLATMPKAELSKILRGNVVIPLFEERLDLLHTLGQTIAQKYDSSFGAVVKEAQYEAEGLVHLLAHEFPSIFDDKEDYQGDKVVFYKRAQLIPAHLYDLHRLGFIGIDVEGCDKLTAFADYKVPQLLRKFGILEYSSELAKKVDSLIELPSGCEEEVEIRAMTIWAIELATKEVKQRIPSATAAKVDGVFWFKGQYKSAADKPYHRTRTIWY